MFWNLLMAPSMLTASIARSGTSSQPIYIRGKTRSGVILRSSGRVMQLQAASNVVIENMTLLGSGVDSGTNASSVCIGFWDGALQENITMRDLNTHGVEWASLPTNRRVRSLSTTAICAAITYGMRLSYIQI